MLKFVIVISSKLRKSVANSVNLNCKFEVEKVWFCYQNWDVHEINSKKRYANPIVTNNVSVGSAFYLYFSQMKVKTVRKSLIVFVGVKQHFERIFKISNNFFFYWVPIC